MNYQTYIGTFYRSGSVQRWMYVMPYFNKYIFISVYFFVSLYICLSFVVAFGSIHYLPCLRTVDFNTQGLECFSDHTIYMLIHVVEDGIQKLSENEAVYGCPIQHAFCNWSYPISHSLTVRAGWNRFQHAFINCNGKKSCSLKKQYFKDAEDLFWRNCTTIQRHMNNVRQSIAYECISGTIISVICTAFLLVLHVWFQCTSLLPLCVLWFQYRVLLSVFILCDT